MPDPSLSPSMMNKAQKVIQKRNEALEKVPGEHRERIREWIKDLSKAGIPIDIDTLRYETNDK